MMLGKASLLFANQWLDIVKIKEKGMHNFVQIYQMVQEL